jgi:hypothetical protein
MHRPVCQSTKQATEMLACLLTGKFSLGIEFLVCTRNQHLRLRQSVAVSEFKCLPELTLPAGGPCHTR